jgi:mono/diheme cytochrome c family protein
MKLGIMAVGACFAGAIALSAAAPQAKNATAKDTKPAANKDANAALISRGRYLVDAAGQCGDCHTPMDKKGQPIKSQALQGAPIMFKPTVPVPGWADTSLPIAGLPTMASDEDAIAFFTTGKHLDGKAAAPPMPQYRFSKKDAEAIVAYLKSLDQGAKK